MRATAPADILTEARGKSASTLARLSYLAEWSGRYDIVEALSPLLPERLPVTFLGPRGHRHRWVQALAAVRRAAACSMVTEGYLARHHIGRRGMAGPALLDVAQDYALQYLYAEGIFDLGVRSVTCTTCTGLARVR